MQLGNQDVLSTVKKIFRVVSIPPFLSPFDHSTITPKHYEANLFITFLVKTFQRLPFAKALGGN